MVGVIANRYTRQSSRVEITEVVSVEDGRIHLVNKREFDGGKVHLNMFTPGTLMQTNEVVNRRGLVSVEMSQELSSHLSSLISR